MTARVLVMAALMAPFNALWVVNIEGVRELGQPTIVSLFFNVIFIVLVATLLNHVVRRLRPVWALSQSELLVLYTLMSILTSPSGLDTLQVLSFTILGPHRFGTPESGWQEMFFAHLPQGMIVDDDRALTRLWEGGAGPLTLGAWEGLLGPLGRWAAFLSALWIAPLGLAVVFRRRWIEAERLTFPIVHLPFEMTRPDGRLFRARLMWAGFALAAIPNILNGLHVLYPAVPEIPIKLNQLPGMNLQSQLLDRPWNSVGTFGLAFYPFIIGLAMLLPMELPLSCVLFYAFFKAQAVGCAWLGLTHRPEFPFMKEQSYGGYLALLAFSLYAGRRYYADVLLRALGVLKKPIDSEEPLPYRAAVLLFVACAVYVIAVGVSQRMALWLSIGFFAQYYVMTCIVGRIRAEMGLPTHEMERLGPTVVFGNVLGKQLLGVQNLTSLSLFFGFTRGIRNVPFPHQAEGLLLASRVGADTRRLIMAMGGAVIVGVVCALWAQFHCGLTNGFGAQWRPGYPEYLSQEAWVQLAGWINQPGGFHSGRVGAAVFGFVFYFGIMVVRTRVLWWPLHPAGFALSTTYFMDHMWCPFLMAFLVKWLLARYGGPKATSRSALFALGLILGDVGCGCLWTLYGVFKHFNAWQFWP